MKKVINTLMALLVVGTMTLAGCGSNASVDTPRAAVEQFLNTLVKGDVEAALDMVAGAEEATAEEKAFVKRTLPPLPTSLAEHMTPTNPRARSRRS